VGKLFSRTILSHFSIDLSIYVLDDLEFKRILTHFERTNFER